MEKEHLSVNHTTAITINIMFIQSLLKHIGFVYVL